MHLVVVWLKELSRCRVSIELRGCLPPLCYDQFLYVDDLTRTRAGAQLSSFVQNYSASFLEL